MLNKKNLFLIKFISIQKLKIILCIFGDFWASFEFKSVTFGIFIIANFRSLKKIITKVTHELFCFCTSETNLNSLDHLILMNKTCMVLFCHQLEHMHITLGNERLKRIGYCWKHHLYLNQMFIFDMIYCLAFFEFPMNCDLP